MNDTDKTRLLTNALRRLLKASAEYDDDSYGTDDAILEELWEAQDQAECSLEIMAERNDPTP
jgi:hypothetical protein